MNIKLQINATAPTRGSMHAAGYDLHAYIPTTVAVRFDEKKQSLVVGTGERVLVPTGVSMEIPTGYYGRIAGRSGMCWNHGLSVMAGVVDSDYRGDIGVMLINHGPAYTLHHGDRVAQIIFEKHYTCDELATHTVVRGASGYGSTGT